MCRQAYVRVGKTSAAATWLERLREADGPCYGRAVNASNACEPVRSPKIISEARRMNHQILKKRNKKWRQRERTGKPVA